MLRTLLLAGALDGCAALVAGRFTNCPEPCDDDGRRTLAEVLTEAGAALGVPTVLGVPVGHVADQWTLPLGAHAELPRRAATCARRRLAGVTPRRSPHPASRIPHRPMKTAQELFAEARQRITEVTPQEVQALRRDGAAFALVDVREGNEWQMGRIPARRSSRAACSKGRSRARAARDAGGALLRERQPVGARRRRAAADGLPRTCARCAAGSRDGWTPAARWSADAAARSRGGAAGGVSAS
jgi:hypothetical protein